MSSYSSLLPAFAAHPDCIGIEITDFDSHRTFKLAFAGKEDTIDFREIRVESKDVQLLESELLSQTHWQVLELHIWENEGTLTRKVATQLSQFKNATHLAVWFNYNRYNALPVKQFPVSLKRLPALQSLKIDGATITDVEALPAIKKLVLDTMVTPEKITEVLSVINPELLFSLSLQGNKMDSLPEIIRMFTNLERLDLSHNQFVQLPNWLMQLENLERLSLYNNPIERTTELKDTHVTKLIKQCTKRKFPQLLRTLFLDLLHNNAQNAETASVHDLLLGLSLDIELLSRKVITELLKKVPNPTTQAGFDVSNHTISLIGKMKGLTASEAIEQLERNNLTATDKLTSKTTLVCVGESLTQKQVEEVLKRNLPIVLPQHLRDFLQHLETPYLKESDESTQENLLRLLRSQDASSVKLAVEMMLTGGIPDGLFYSVLLLNFLKFGGYKALFKKLLEKYTTPEQYEFIKKNQKAGFYKTMDVLFKTKNFDVSAIAKAGLLVFAIDDQSRSGSYGEEGFYRSFHYIVKRCFVAGGEPARLAYQAQLQGTTLNMLFADDTHFGKFKLPVEILEFEQIEKIICAQNVVTEVVTNQKTLKKMKNLKALELYHYNLQGSSSYEKGYIGNMKGIEALKQLLPQVQITLHTYHI